MFYLEDDVVSLLSTYHLSDILQAIDMLFEPTVTANDIVVINKEEVTCTLSFDIESKHISNTFDDDRDNNEKYYSQQNGKGCGYYGCKVSD